MRVTNEITRLGCNVVVMEPNLEQLPRKLLGDSAHSIACRKSNSEVKDDKSEGREEVKFKDKNCEGQEVRLGDINKAVCVSPRAPTILQETLEKALISADVVCILVAHKIFEVSRALIGQFQASERQVVDLVGLLSDH